RDLLERAARVLLLKVGAAEIWIGPEITSDAISSWEAVQQRLAENLPFETDAVSVADFADVAALFPIVLAAEAETIAAVAIARFLTDQETIGQMIKCHDLALHETSEHRFHGVIPKTAQRPPLALAEWIDTPGAPRPSVGSPRTVKWDDGGLRS